MLLHRAAWVVPVTAPPIADGALAIADGRIQALGPWQELRRSHPGAEVIDHGAALLLPPLVNAHTHLELTDFPQWQQELAAALTPVADDFVGWIERVIQVKRQVAVDRIPASIARGAERLLASGTLAVGDILSLPHLAPHYRELPLFGCLFLETLGVDPQATHAAYERLRLQVGQGSTGPFVTGLAPHAPYTLSPLYLGHLLTEADALHWRVSIHLAESPDETRLLRDGAGAIAERLYPLVGWEEHLPTATGLRPWPYLQQAGPVDQRCLLVHGVQINATEAAEIAASGATVVLCPRSNARLGVGTAPVAAYRDAGVPLALGTDSLASNDSLSLWDELAFAAEAYRGALDAEALLRLATVDGARALGVAALERGLAQGADASFQVVTCPLGELPVADALCTAGPALQVRQLYRQGTPLLSHEARSRIMGHATRTALPEGRGDRYD